MWDARTHTRCARMHPCTHLQESADALHTVTVRRQLEEHSFSGEGWGEAFF